MFAVAFGPRPVHGWLYWGLGKGCWASLAHLGAGSRTRVKAEQYKSNWSLRLCSIEFKHWLGMWNKLSPVVNKDCDMGLIDTVVK